MVICKEIDINGQEMDESGYYCLIKVDFTTRRIGLRVVNSNHVEVEDFWGRQCQDIYCTVLGDSRSVEWFQDSSHIAYIGKELKKAEIALATGSGYYQE